MSGHTSASRSPRLARPRPSAKRKACISRRNSPRVGHYTPTGLARGGCVFSAKAVAEVRAQPLCVNSGRTRLNATPGVISDLIWDEFRSPVWVWSCVRSGFAAGGWPAVECCCIPLIVHPPARCPPASSSTNDREHEQHHRSGEPSQANGQPTSQGGRASNSPADVQACSAESLGQGPKPRPCHAPGRRSIRTAKPSDSPSSTGAAIQRWWAERTPSTIAAIARNMRSRHPAR